MDEGGFVLDYALPVGSSLEQTDAVCRRIESVLLQTPEVASLSRRTGAELGFFATEQFTGDMLVGLTSRAKRKRSVLDVIGELRDRLARETPQADVEFVQVMQDTIADLAGNPTPIEVKILGGEYPALQSAADGVEKAISAVPGIVDVKNHVSFGSPELSWRPDPLRAARLGLTTETIAAEVSAQMLGDVATKIQEATASSMCACGTPHRGAWRRRAPWATRGRRSSSTPRAPAHGSRSCPSPRSAASAASSERTSSSARTRGRWCG
jgi:multidrug efflux pump subunit AcrB